MKPNLTPPHGTSLATTAGITAIIVTVAAMALLGQCSGLTGPAASLAGLAIAFLLASSGCLYLGRNEIGKALDLAAGDADASKQAAAAGFVWFHGGMAALFAGCAAAAAFRIGLPLGGAGWLAPAVAGVLCVVAIGRAMGWSAESRRLRTMIPAK